MNQEQANEKFIEACKRIAKLQNKHGEASEKLSLVKKAYETFVVSPSNDHYDKLLEEIKKVEEGEPVDMSPVFMNIS